MTRASSRPRLQMDGFPNKLYLLLSILLPIIPTAHCSLFSFSPSAPSQQAFLIRHATAVFQNHLYIDGGIRSDNPKSNNPNKYTLQIDLGTPWNYHNVTPQRIRRTDPYPSRVSEYMYPGDQFVLVYSGYKYTEKKAGPGEGLEFLTPRQPFSESSWGPPPDPFPFPEGPSLMGSATWNSSNFWALGGGYLAQGRFNSDPNLTAIASPEIGNTQTYNPKFDVANGRAQLIQHVGEEGVIIFLAGQSVDPGTQDLSTAPYVSMSKVWIYDIAKNKYYLQHATSDSGDLPGGRIDTCIVGVMDSQTKGYDIFLYGGSLAPDVQGSTTENNGVWVLTLPSFVWTRVSGPDNQLGRTNHECNPVGRSQMAVVGGLPASATDQGVSPSSWIVGPRIFNLKTLTWQFNYNPDAPSYTRPESIVKIAKAQPTPDTWDNKAVQSLFEKHAANKNDGSNNNHGSNKSGGSNNSDGSSLSGGAIAGIVIGCIAGIVLIIAGILYYKRYQKRKTDNVNQTQGGEWQYEKRGELPGPMTASEWGRDSTPVELSSQNQTQGGPWIDEKRSEFTESTTAPAWKSNTEPKELSAQTTPAELPS